MNPASPFPGPSPALAFGLDLAARATALLAIAFLLLFLLGRRRAFLGAAAGNAGLIGLALLPFSVVLFPTVSIPCLPAGTTAPRGAEAPAAFADGPLGDPFAGAVSRVPTDDGLAFASETRDLPALAPAPPIAATLPLPPGSRPDAPTPPPPAAATEAGPIAWATVALGLYAVVASALLARLGASLRAIARLRGSCEPFAEVAWTEALDRWRGRLGIRRAVALASSPAVSVPLVLGWLRPVIVVPRRLTVPEACGHADAVLLHELSHVRRGDYPWNLFLRAVQAFYWPHVLVWILGRTIAGVRERACDDLCVHEMGGPGAYRETLLAVAAGMVRTPGPALGLAMARPSRLGRRLAQIDRSRGIDRCVPRWPARFALATLAAVAAVAIGAIQLVRTEARAAMQGDPPKAPETAAPAPPVPNPGRVFHLRVVAADTHEPVADAEVRVSVALRTVLRKADAQGRLDITHSTGPSDRAFGVDAWGKGRAMQRHSWGSDPSVPIPDGATIELLPGEILGGLAQDEAGRPIAGATVYLWSHNYKKRVSHELLYDLPAVTGPDGRWQTSGAPETTGELLGFQIHHPDFLSSRDYSQKEIAPKIADLRAGNAVTVMKKGVPIEGRVVSADGTPVAGARVLSTYREDAMFSELEEFAVTTDADGRFRTGQVKPGRWFLIASAKGHGPGDRSVRIGTAVPQVEIALGRPHPFQGRVVDPDGKPIAGAFIDPDVWRGHRCLGAYLWTDADGRFRWDDGPNDELLVNISEGGYANVFWERVAPSAEELIFTLTPSLTIQGTVRDAETQEKLARAEVEFGAVDPETGEPATWTGVSRSGSSPGVRGGNLRVNIPVISDAYKLRIRSPGFTPFISRTFRREERVVTNYDVSLVPGRAGGAVATALRPDGQPLAGARVYSTLTGFNVNGSMVEDRGPGGNGREQRTGPDGTFTPPQDEKPWLVLILGDDVYGYASRETLAASPRIRTKPYARIEGRYLVGNQPLASRVLALNGLIQNRATMNLTLYLDQATPTAADGRFAFKSVIPADGLRVSRHDHKAGPRPDWWLGEPVRVEPGGTAQVTLGGRGRPVSGRVEPPRGWKEPLDFTDRSTASIESNRPWIPSPLSLFRGMTTLKENGWGEWVERWSESPEGRDYRDRRVAASVALAPDGSFRFDDVPPGEYRLAVRVNEGPGRRERGPFAHRILVFTVPPIPGGRSDDPLDLGPVRLRTRVALDVGEPAPAFEVTTVDGKALRVPGDFRGKFLLLDFGTMWDAQSPFQIARLNEVNQRFGEDPRFAILSLVCAADRAETRAYVEEKGEAWPQAIVGPLSNPISDAYGVDDGNIAAFPAAILLGLDGKIVAKELHYDQIGKTIGEALSRAQP